MILTKLGKEHLALGMFDVSKVVIGSFSGTVDENVTYNQLTVATIKSVNAGAKTNKGYTFDVELSQEDGNYIVDAIGIINARDELVAISKIAPIQKEKGKGTFVFTISLDVGTTKEIKFNLANESYVTKKIVDDNINNIKIELETAIDQKASKTELANSISSAKKDLNVLIEQKANKSDLQAEAEKSKAATTEAIKLVKNELTQLVDTKVAGLITNTKVASDLEKLKAEMSALISEKLVGVAAGEAVEVELNSIRTELTKVVDAKVADLVSDTKLEEEINKAKDAINTVIDQKIADFVTNEKLTQSITAVNEAFDVKLLDKADKAEIEKSIKDLKDELTFTISNKTVDLATKNDVSIFIENSKTALTNLIDRKVAGLANSEGVAGDLLKLKNELTTLINEKFVEASAGVEAALELKSIKEELLKTIELKVADLATNSDVEHKIETLKSEQELAVSQLVSKDEFNTAKEQLKTSVDQKASKTELSSSIDAAKIELNDKIDTKAEKSELDQINKQLKDLVFADLKHNEIFEGFTDDTVFFAGPAGEITSIYTGTEKGSEITKPTTATESDQFEGGIKLNPANKDDYDSALHIPLDRTRFNGGMTVAMEYYIDPDDENDFEHYYLTLLSFGNNHTWDGGETDTRAMTNLEVRARHRGDYNSINFGYSNEADNEAKGLDAVGNKNTLVAIFNPNDDHIRVYHNNQEVIQEGSTKDYITTQWNKPYDFYTEVNFGGNHQGYNEDPKFGGRQTKMHIGRIALYSTAKPDLATDAEALLSPERITKSTQVDTKVITGMIANKADRTEVESVEKTLSEKIDNIKVPEVDNHITKVFVRSQKLEGLSQNINDGAGPYYRVPTIIIEDENTMHLFGDARLTCNDMMPCDAVYAKSVDGGKTWAKKVIAKNSGTTDRSRVMDATAIRTKSGKIFALYGNWDEGAFNWATTGRDSYKAWKCMTIAISEDDGETWTQKYIGDGCELPLTTGADIGGDGGGMIGSCDAGLELEDGTLVFAVQCAVPGAPGGCGLALITSTDGGATWKRSNFVEKSASETSIAYYKGGIVTFSKPEGGEKRYVSYYTKDLGETWEEFEPLHLKFKANVNKCKAGMRIFTTRNGVECCVVTFPQTLNTHHIWGRDNITAFAINLHTGEMKPIVVLNNRPGTNAPVYRAIAYGGYSSVDYWFSGFRDVYAETTRDDGGSGQKGAVNTQSDNYIEKLVCVYEEDLGITFRDISEFLPEIEWFCSKQVSETDAIKTEILKAVKSEGAGLPPKINNKLLSLLEYFEFQNAQKKTDLVFADAIDKITKAFVSPVEMGEMTHEVDSSKSTKLSSGVFLEPETGNDLSKLFKFDLSKIDFEEGLTFIMELFVEKDKPFSKTNGVNYPTIFSFDVAEGAANTLELRARFKEGAQTSMNPCNTQVTNKEQLFGVEGKFDERLVIALSGSDKAGKYRMFLNGTEITACDESLKMITENKPTAITTLYIGGSGRGTDGRSIQANIGRVALYKADKITDTETNVEAIEALLNPVS